MSSISRSGNAPRPNIASQVREQVNKASDAAKTAGTKAANAAKTTGTQAANAAVKAYKTIDATGAKSLNQASSWHAGAQKTATANAQALGSGGALAKGLTGASLAAGVYGIGTYGKGLVSSIKNGEGGHAIADNALRLTKSTLGTTKAVLDTRALLSSAKDFSKLSAAATAAVDKVGIKGGKLSSAIAEAAATAVHNGKAVSNVDVMASIAKTKGFLSTVNVGARTAASNLLRSGGFENAASKIDNGVVKAGQAALDAATAGKAVSTSKAAATAVNVAKGAESAISASAKGVGTAAKTAGRFTPGLNVAIAATDVAIAANTLADPNASVAAKVTTSITAAGSVLAATNIPIVSQVGAAVSLVSTGVGAVIENAGAIADGAKAVGGAIVDGAQAVGGAIADGAKAVGGAIAEGAKKIFSGW